MAPIRSLVLTGLTAMVIYTLYLFSPAVTYEEVTLSPKCLKLFEDNQYLCAYSASIGGKGASATPVRILNQQGIRAFGIKTKTSLSTTELLYLVDYQNSPMKNQQIEMESMPPALQLIKIVGLQALKTEDSELETHLPQEVTIQSSDYQHFVVYQISKTADKMLSKILLLDNDMNQKLALVASLAGLICTLVIGLNQCIRHKRCRQTIWVSMAILISVTAVALSGRSHTEQYEYSSILFFTLCLIKVHTKKPFILILMAAMTVASTWHNQHFVLCAYIGSLFLVCLQGYNQLAFEQHFLYTVSLMIAFIVAHQLRIYSFNQQHQSWRGLIQIGILTIGTVLMETTNQKIIQQFREFPPNVDDQMTLKGFEKVQENQE